MEKSEFCKREYNRTAEYCKGAGMTLAEGWVAWGMD